MKSVLLFVALFILPATALAEKATYDLVRYTPPAPWKKTAWKKEVKDKTSVSYTMTDPKARTYCQIFIMQSMVTNGDLTADFESEWKNIIVKSYAVTEAPQMTDAAEENGWQVKAGVATFAFDGGTSIAMLTTISGYGRMTSIVAVTSDKNYLSAVQALLGSIEMNKPAGSTAAATTATSKATSKAKSTAKETAKPRALQGYMDYSPFTKTWTWKLRYPPK